MRRTNYVPEGWASVRLGDVCELIRDGDWIESKDQGGNEYRLLQISNIGIGEFVETGKFRWITQDTFTRLSCTEIAVGDILLARMPDPIGRAWYVSELPWKAIASVDIAIIRTNDDLAEATFVTHYANSSECLSAVDGLSTGTTRRRVRRSDVEQLPILLPPLSEQRAIAAVLDSIDEAIERTEAVIAAIEQLRDSLLHELLTRGVPGWHTEWKDVPGLGTIPVDWEVVRLGDRIAEGPTNGIYKPESEYGDGTWLIRIDDFMPGALVRSDGFDRIQVADGERDRYGIFEGDILINRVNSLSHVGKPVLIPKLAEHALFESNMMRVRMCSDVHPEFAMIVLMSKHSLRYFASRAKKAVQQASINQQDVSQLPLPLPSWQEQVAITNASTVLKDRRAGNHLTLKDLRALKVSASYALLTGGVRVPIIEVVE